MTMIEKVISIAQKEIGTCEPLGDDKYIKVYNQLTGAGFGMSVAWCAIFVTWVMYTAGVAKTIVPYYASCNIGMNWFKNRKQFRRAKAYGGAYMPKAGDIVFFSSRHNQNNSTHTGIVTGIYGNTLRTIEGNTSDAVHERNYDLSSNYILGFGVPEYGTEGMISTADSLSGYETHMVIEGDSLWKLAQKYLGNGTRYKEFMTLNSLTSTTIHAGLVLMIPGTSENANKAATKTQVYTVKKGDSLWQIAVKLLKDGSRYKEIMMLSGIGSTIIHAGQVLTVPAA